MKVFFKTFITLNLVMLLIACDSKKEERKALKDELIQLEMELDSTYAYLLSNKIDTLSEIQLSISSVILRIKNNLHTEKVDTVLSKKLDRYKVVGKDIGQNQRVFLKTKRAYLEEKTHLSNLNHDLENGLTELELFTEYIVFEKNKVDQIKELTLSFVREKNRQIEIYTSLHNELNPLSLQLLKVNEK